MKSGMMAAALVAIVVAVSGNGGDAVPRAEGVRGGATVHVPCTGDAASCGAALQSTINAAAAGTTITLDAGKVYEASLVVHPREGASAERVLTITTRGWSNDGEAWEGLVTPADKPRMAVLRGTARATAALAVVNGDGAGFLSIRGLAFDATPPAGQGDLIRIGSGDARARAELPRHVSITQVLLQGDRGFGQRRGIAANGMDIAIEQIWCEEMFNAGQDSQCVGAWNGAQRVRVRHAYLAAASENIMIGGAPVPTAEMQPEDWLIEDVILHKPLRWREDGRKRQVKNLLEFKHGRTIVARRILAVNNWRAAQDGRGLLIHYTTNGRCPDCGNLEHVLVEDLVMLNVEGGVSLQGHSWQPDSFSDGKLRDVTLRHLYVQIAGRERAIQISNVRGAHDITIERSTFINNGSSWLVGSFGRAWSDDTSVEDGSPMAGLRVIENVFAANGEYGITAPEGRHFGTGVGEFVASRLQIAGNVIGDAPRQHLGHYNRHTADGAANVSASRAAMLQKLSAQTCGEWAEGRGAGCERLQPIFAWLRRLPEP